MVPNPLRGILDLAAAHGRVGCGMALGIPWQGCIENQINASLKHVVFKTLRVFFWSFSVNKPPVQLGVGKKYFSIRNKPPVLI